MIRQWFRWHDFLQQVALLSPKGTILFCYLRRNVELVEASCHKQDSMTRVSRRRLLIAGDGRRISAITYTPSKCWRHATVQQWSMSKPEYLLVENRDFSLSEEAPVGINIVWYWKTWKTRMAWLPDGEKFWRYAYIPIVSTEYTNVTDTQTAGQTNGQTPHTA